MNGTATDYNIQLLLEANDKASKVIEGLSKDIDKLKKNIDSTTKTTNKATNDVNNALGSIWKTIKSLWLVALFVWIGKSISDLGEDLEPISQSFKNLSESAGIAGDEMLEAMRKASQGTVSDFNLMSAANKAYSLGVVSNIEEMTTLMQIASVKGQNMGRTMDEALNDIVTGLGRGSAMILDNLGIIVNQAEAQEKYAQSIGKTVEQLTEQEKKQALINQVVADGKRELEEMGEQSTTFATKVAQITTVFENFGARVGVVLNQALGGGLDNSLKKIEDFFDKVAWRVEENAENISNAIDAIWDSVGVIVEAVIGAISMVKETINNLFSFIGDIITAIAGENEDGISSIMGDRTDLFYFIEQGVNVVAWIFKTAFAYVSTLMNWRIQTAYDVANFFSEVWDDATSDISGFFVRLWKEALNSLVSLANKGIEAIASMVERVDDLLWLGIDTSARKIDLPFEVEGGTIGKLKELWGKIKDNLFTKPFEAAEGEFNNMVSNMMETYTDRVAEVERSKYKVNETISPTKTKLKGAGGGSDSDILGGSSKKGGVKDKVNELKEYYEALNYQLDRQKKNINDLNSEYQSKFNEIENKVKDTEKVIEWLNDDINNLKNNLAELKVDENKSIAKEVVNVRKELQALEEQYQGLWEVADSVSRKDLEGVGGVWKFDVDIIKQYKDYQDELASMYDGMSASEQQALDKEIEYATRYDSLNGIEKIKEDYRIRQEEIQTELDSKINALNTEQSLLRSYKKEQDKLQDEWIKRIDEERAKREGVYNELKGFEEKYMEQLTDDHNKQVEMCDKLVDHWNEVYRAKMRAMSAWSDGSRASGGPVYQWNSYLVGETWPEMFIPSTNWRIVKNSDLENMNNGEISINLNMGGVVISNGSDEKELARSIIDEIKRGLELSKKGISIY